jgi:triose/dihydroxyacetone kinase / FAD-AMP lyase (cyclizing)
MSTKHYYPDKAANSLTPLHLNSLVCSNPHLSLIESERVVYQTQNDPSAVSVISGGGSGHEPAWAGYVGNGLLSAVAQGDIFASPSTKQVLAAVKAAPSSEGTILMITNYTGDKLHFGLAAERAKAAGAVAGAASGKVVVLPSTDDVSIGRSKCSAVGRRGLPGHVISKSNYLHILHHDKYVSHTRENHGLTYQIFCSPQVCMRCRCKEAII